MSHRFRFIGEEVSGQWQLGEEETLHLAKVLKLTVGTEVEVTNGKGTWCLGTVSSIKNKQTLIDVLETHAEPEPKTFVTLAVGALKPGAIDDILPAAVELGADKIVVFQNAGTAKFLLQESVATRWQRIVHQSIKQCKRARIPAVVVTNSLDALIKDHWQQSSSSGATANLGIVLDATGEEPLHKLLTTNHFLNLMVVIGSEKGLETREMSQLTAAGFVTAKLGSNILRAVTAVPAVLGVVASITK
jgi:16S rRNA (uracil1498-N3)-methyltransferase